jgi:hypothetical protein
VTGPDEAATAHTGHPRVDEALAAVVRASDDQPADQVVPLAEADRVLRETLDSIGDV